MKISGYSVGAHSSLSVVQDANINNSTTANEDFEHPGWMANDLYDGWFSEEFVDSEGCSIFGKFVNHGVLGRNHESRDYSGLRQWLRLPGLDHDARCGWSCGLRETALRRSLFHERRDERQTQQPSAGHIKIIHPEVN